LFRERILAQAPPWMLSAAVHMMLFILIALLPYHVAARNNGGGTSVEMLDQSQFEETTISRFELGSTPLAPRQAPANIRRAREPMSPRHAFRTGQVRPCLEGRATVRRLRPWRMIS